MTLEAILERVAGPAAPRASAPPAELPPWKPDPPLEPREKPEAEYGYLWEETVNGTTRDGLISWLSVHPTTPAVWTPETEAPARPEDVPSLFPDLREEARKGARFYAVFRGVIAAVLVTLVVVLELVWGWGSRSIFFLFGIIAAAEFGRSVLETRSAAPFDATGFARRREDARHKAWFADQQAPLTRWMVILIGVVAFFATGDNDSSVAVGGLVKDVVWAEPFRLLTAAMLHVLLVHAWMNGLALLWVGKLLEVHAPRGRMPLVFLVSALGGSLASAILLPATSVGASGGILGIMGYLLVMAHRRPHQFPGGLTRHLGDGVVVTAIAGMLGFALIDNAGHAGGFVTGLLLARALVPAEETPEPAWLRWAGWASLAVITVTAAGTLYLIFFDPLGSAAGL